jgi:hypothetical protein
MADRIVGKRAALYVYSGSWNYVADIFDWSVECETVTLDASIKGDVAERMIPSHTRGRLTARRYVQAGLALANNVVNAAVSGTRLDWAVVSVDTIPPTVSGFTGNAFAKIQGTGYVTRGTVDAPRGPVVDGWEVSFDTVPVMA